MLNIKDKTDSLMVFVNPTLVDGTWYLLTSLVYLQQGNVKKFKN